ncbi:hypothetical protein O7627_01650 [Solwaraspora sp. WMMD1047]|uniref:AAA family ATPase n=1 Tax=Solwaraspora sp. WMMD1047 TaxID=3016102 RepID=UPI002417A3F4|nr:AAA family ATPase [Solwaraspora sp. WMMD1047]MDG4828005.1 hypothetical protein [Solwaraspora sp. WMMD1047]
MEKSPEIVNRDVEWATLADFLRHPDQHLRLGVLSGRRRVGKSFLLRALARASGGLYVTAVAEEAAPAARLRFATAIARYAGVSPDLIGTGATWEALLEAAMNQVIRQCGPGGLLVIDELPYWMAHSPELPGLLQLLYDRSQAGDGPAGGRIILCGSAISVMNDLLSGTKALRGRASVDVRLAPFDLATTARLWGIADPPTALRLHAVLGGSPGYRDLAALPPPQSLPGFDTWVTGTVLDPRQALYSRSETEYLLREDPRFTGSTLHYAILGAVAAGATSPAKIGAVLERDRTALTRPIEALTSAGYLRYLTDPLWDRRPVITIADPIVRFHNLVTLAHYDLVETGRAAQAWQAARATFSSRILGPHFEHCARDWLRHHLAEAGEDQTGQIAATVVNDRNGRARHEVDVIGLRRQTGRAVITWLGEAKATLAPRGPADLDRLVQVKELLRQHGHDVSGSRLAVFSTEGFARDLAAAAGRRDDVLLVDLATMFGAAPADRIR